MSDPGKPTAQATLQSLPLDESAVTNIPQELQNRDQWLQWDASADSPRRPHWRADFYVSWSDSNDWHSFEKARQAAQEVDSWGIGYVFANTNEDYPEGRYGGLDLDGCIDADGRPKDWLPSLQPFFDAGAYVERSPSGTGIHIPLAGFEPPEWWTDQHFTDDEHEGVEAYGNKFFTVTGDRVRNAGDEVAAAGEWVEDWLVEAYTAITGDDPTKDQTAVTDFAARGGTGRQHRDEFLTESDIREALAQVDPDVSYTVWRDIGFALADFFDSDATALSVFTDWSGGGTKWDDAAPERAERIIRDATPGGGRTIGTVIHHARRGGWELPAPNTDGIRRGGEPEVGADISDVLVLEPSNVRVVAGLGEDGEVSDLTDREKAASVWHLLRQSEEFHVRVRRDNESLWAYDDGVWTKEGVRDLRHAGRQALGAMNYGQNVLAELKAQARSDPEVEVDADTFGLAPGHLAVENGLLDLDRAADGAGEDALRALRPEDYALTRLPVEYAPSAAYDEWQAYVEEWAEPGMADALQEYVGYCLHVGAMPIHRALLLVGSGANGKGTFLTVVRALLGEENTTDIELQALANESDALADFYGSLANIDEDLSTRKLGAGLGTFKKLVGGDRVRGRHLYEDAFEFDATGKHLYAANEVPEVEISDDDEAFWRRWLLVEFPNHYPLGERDQGLDARFTDPAALAGVLNWAIKGRHRLLEQGYFTSEERHAQAKRERWQAWGESVDKFISDCVERVADAEKVTTGEAHRRYEAWCRENGEDPIGQQQFTTKLKTEDVGYKDSLRVPGYSSPRRGYEALGFSDDVPSIGDPPERRNSDDARQQHL